MQLKSADAAQRAFAVVTIRKAITSPKLAADVESLMTELTATR